MHRANVRGIFGIALTTAPLLLLAGCSCCTPRPCSEPACAPGPTPRAPIAAAPAADAAQVLVEIEVFRVPAGAGRSQLETSLLRAPSSYGTLTKAQADELRTLLSKDPRVELLAMPSIVTPDGQEDSIFIGEAVGPDVPGRTGTEPLTFAGGDNWTGMRAALIATVVEGGATVHMDFTFASRDPVGVGKAPDLAASRASEVRVPNRRLSIASGETAVLGAEPPSGAAASRLVVFVTPTVLHPADRHGPAAVAPPPVAASKPAAVAAAVAPPAPTRAEALKTTRLTLSFTDEPLYRVLQAMAAQGNLQLAVSPAVKNVPVTLDVRDQDVSTILTALGEGRFAWTVEDYGIVRITGVPAK